MKLVQVLDGGAATWYTASDVQLGWAECSMAVQKKHTHTDTHTHTHTAGVAKLGERGEAVVHGSAMVGTQAGRGHVQRRVGTARDSSRGGVAGG
jgi:hypothetical protein